MTINSNNLLKNHLEHWGLIQIKAYLILTEMGNLSEQNESYKNQQSWKTLEEEELWKKMKKIN